MTAKKPPGEVRRKPRGPDKKKRRAPQRITVAIYNVLREAWFERQELRYAARKAGVSDAMARRYILGPANPGKGFVRINDRWLQAQAEAQDRQDLDYVEFQSRVLALIKGGFESIKGELYLVQRDVMRRITQYQTDLAAWEALSPKERAGQSPPVALPFASIKDLAAAVQRLAQVGERTLTGVDQRIAVDGAVDDPLHGITEDQLLRMIEAGLFPDEMPRVLSRPVGDDAPN